MLPGAEALADRRIGFLGVRRLLLDARAVAQRDLVDGVAAPPGTVLMLACPDRDDDAAVLPSPDDRVLRVRRAVDEVPLAQRPFLAFDDEQCVAVHDQEVLLIGLPVVHRHRLVRREPRDVDADLRPVLPALEVAEPSASGDVPPARVARIQHEPPLSGRDDPVLGLLERRLGNH
jgi:hypothetical protein